MGKPIVLYEQLAEYDFVFYEPAVGVTEVSGFPASNSLSPFTFPADSWMFERGSGSSAVTYALFIRVNIPAGEEIDSIGVVINGIEDDEIPELSILKLGDSTPIVVGTLRNGVNLFTFDSQVESSDQLYLIRLRKLNIASSDSTPISIPVIVVGKKMEFEKCIMKSYAPLDYNRATEYLTNESGTGQFMGRSIVRRNHESSVSFDLMSAAWVRSTFQPFVRHARTKPYFFAWNYDDYPNEVNYVWTDEDIGISYTGDRDKMSASWKMRGLGNDPE